MHKQSQGVMSVRVTYNRRVFIEPLLHLLSTKKDTQQQEYLTPSYNEKGESEVKIVKITYTEDQPRMWGGTKPKMIIEFDEQNRYLLTVTIQYNRKLANKLTVLTQKNLVEQLEREFTSYRVWDTKGDDHTDEMLAVDKRKLIDEQAA